MIFFYRVNCDVLVTKMWDKCGIKNGCSFNKRMLIDFAQSSEPEVLSQRVFLPTQSSPKYLQK